MKVLITGANGLLGQKLCGLLVGRGVEFLATSRGNSRLNNLPGKINYQPLDITDRIAVKSICEAYGPDVIVNTAAMTNVDQCVSDPEGCQELNVTAVEHLIEYCVQHNCRLVHLSTDFIFDGENGPYKEDDPANPISIYGQSKLDGEELIKNSTLEWTIIRTVLVYGISSDMSRSNIVLWVKESLEKKKPINVVDDQWRTPTLAEDLAMGCFLAIECKASGVFNISGEEMMTPYDIAIQTADFYDLDKSLITRVNASTFSQPAKRPPKTGFILDKAKKVLGYKPKSFAEGLSILNAQIEALS